MRKFKFVSGQSYHIYNRGVDKRDIFIDDRDYVRFIRSMRGFNRINPTGSLLDIEKRRPSTSQKDVEGLVDFTCYCLNPNHYHFLLRQVVVNGISEFMKRIGDGYTKYFNIKYQRSGSLFQGTYKAAETKSDEHLLNIAAYINANAQIHRITDDPSKYPWCSHPDYLNLRRGTLCNKETVLNNFKNIGAYKIFVEGSTLNIKRDRKLQKLLLE